MKRNKEKSPKEMAYRRNQSLINTGAYTAMGAGYGAMGHGIRKMGHKKTGAVIMGLGALSGVAAVKSATDHVKYRKKAKGARVGGYGEQMRMAGNANADVFQAGKPNRVRKAFFAY